MKRRADGGERRHPNESLCAQFRRMGERVMKFGIVFAAAVAAVSMVSTANAGVTQYCENWEENCWEPKDCTPGGGDTPEPASLSVLAIGGAALLLRGRRTK
jgi:hypothetical protein